MAVEGTPFAAFEKASFGGLEFPYSELIIKGGARFTVHEFPHSPGGEIEKGGRRVYMITFRAFFHDIPKSVLATEYPDLFPLKSRRIRTMFENEVTDDLLVPNIGKIPCYCVNWTESINTKASLTGSSFEFEFVEDQERATLTDGEIDLGTFGDIEVKFDEMLAQAALRDFKSTAALSFMQKVSDAVTSVQAIAGTADAFTRVMEGKLRAIENLCIWGDSQLRELQDPENHLVINALKSLWYSTMTLADNITESQQRMLTYRVPVRMTVTQISTAIYGKTDKAYDLMQINPFDDALAIPAGTIVKYLTDGS